MTMSSLVAQRLKRLPAIRETWVRSLGREDPLEKEMATHSSTGESHGGRSLIGYSPRGHKESDTTERLYLLTYLLSSTLRPVCLDSGYQSVTIIHILL